jgi:hypothetical protein
MIDKLIKFDVDIPVEPGPQIANDAPTQWADIRSQTSTRAHHTLML